ncbi:Cu-processing system ATP-binding protein [Acidovorax sp. 69]|uniref:ABC transporter ATP-binding protein n=1 Tax=Acidovorax sp. 69 TaxID=2035202 RepID=UPI000C23970D|nr:ABC transporter ATP-binding protein [Acidovorax sp. 69]PJI98733.1 Cu-processing system ATP-binding protein [Acidovorax sp. 69]
MTRNPPPIDLREPAAIEVRGAHKHYGALHAVDGIDLRVERGEILGLIGHNGAGKSTLFKMILGLVPATSGEIRVGGATVQGRDFRAARRHLGYLPENVVLYDNLSGLETLRFFAKLKGAPLAQCAPLLEQVGLAHAGNRPVREYSKGMRQRLGFAQALLGSPQVLLLDEPTNGLDPQAIRDFYATLRGLQAQGVTIVITSHILAELQERVDRLAILAAGKLQALGSVQALREQTHMPLAIDLTLAAADQPAGVLALAALPGITTTATPDGLHVDCPRSTKMAVLAALAPLGARLLDVNIHEPSLEDVYFGLRGE